MAHDALLLFVKRAPKADMHQREFVTTVRKFNPGEQAQIVERLKNIVKELESE